ncbi:MAG: TrkA family potassium uptake protein [Clostridia bacterium]|nr:TrkA family potassium uptake protein [Clostridia bacterium]
MFVIVVGGGKIGYYLAQTLLGNGHEVLLIEKNQERSRRLEAILGEDVVLTGDGSEPAVLEEAGIARADAVAAVTGLDEDNIVIYQLAERVFHCPRVIGRVNNPRNEEVFKLLGCPHVVNSTKLVYRMVQEEVDIRNIKPLLALKGGQVEFVELMIDSHSPALGKPLVDLNLPQNCQLLVVIRDNELIFVRGQTKLQEGDRVIALVATEDLSQLQAVLQGPE